MSNSFGSFILSYVLAKSKDIKLVADKYLLTNAGTLEASSFVKPSYFNSPCGYSYNFIANHDPHNNLVDPNARNVSCGPISGYSLAPCIPYKVFGFTGLYKNESMGIRP